MITSIFNKSKSVNFLIVFFIAFLALVIARVRDANVVVSFVFFLKQVAVLFLIYGSILLLNFILAKNSLTKKNNYEMLLFSLFLLTITQTTAHSNILVSNFFILLALRRIISLQSQKNIKKKLFDASYWIGIACLFYFWSILFFVLLPVSLILYADNNLRHWIIPFLGILAIFLIAVAASVILDDTYFGLINISPKMSYDFSNYNSVEYLVAITLLISFGIWSSIFYLKNIKNKKKALRTSFRLIIITAVIAFLIVVQAPIKNGSEFLFLFAPLAIIITNYIEIIKEKWFKEVFLSVLIITPFILLLL